jgi:hypothetical protein
MRNTLQVGWGNIVSFDLLLRSIQTVKRFIIPRIRGIVWAALILLCGLASLDRCRGARIKESPIDVGPKPEIRQKLVAYGLPKGFFAPDADRCGHQIIGYRFVVWLGNDAIAIGFNTSPNCRVSPASPVSGVARVLVFTATGSLRGQRDLSYLADGNGEIVAPGEASPGPRDTLLFRIESVNLDPNGGTESRPGLTQLDAGLREIAHLDRFLERTTFAGHAPVFGDTNELTLFDGAPLAEIRRWPRSLPVAARDRSFGEHGTAYMVCSQELRPNEYVFTDVVYAGARQRCVLQVEEDDGGGRWTASLRDNETASIVGLLADRSVVGHISQPENKTGQLVVWKKNKTVEVLPWISDSSCGAVDSATADMSRYAVFAPDGCDHGKGLLELLSMQHSTSRVGRWIVFDRRSRTVLVDRPLPKNARAALSPDGLHYASFEEGELRIYSLPAHTN